MSFTAEGRLFVTLDLDFSDVRRYKPGTHPGIFLIRVRVAAVRLLLSLAFRRDQDSSAPEVRVLRASASGPPGSHRCGGTPKPVSAGWAANRHDRSVLAQLCIRHGLTMLTADQDFMMAAAHCPLRVWRPAS
jgi:predicted nuclease of predicted toxin-antitoxin system